MNISVVIPVKNRAHLLPVTLDNILNQTKKPYEIFVVDDGSTDDLESIISAYKDRVVFTKSNGKGPGAARNKGLQLATGNMIQFFDSDDLMTKNKLEVQAHLLQEEEADFVYGPFVKARYENEQWKQEDVIMQYRPLRGKCLADYVMQGWCNIFQSALFKRALIDEAGKWNEDILTHEDYEYWFRIGQITNKFVHENKSCVVYRQHQQQITDLQTVEKAKWYNEITAIDLIKNEMCFKPSMHSFLLFRGREFNSKSGYREKFNEEARISINEQNRFLVPYYKLFHKLGRVQTGTNWQMMHGVLNAGNDEFKKYIKNLL